MPSSQNTAATQAVQRAGDIARIDLAFADVGGAARVEHFNRDLFVAHGVQFGGNGRLKRLAGRSRIQVNRLDDAVATQNMKKPIV
jgi:hypothetical protein